MARSARLKDIDNYTGSQAPGYYQRVSIEDIINNFIVAYIGKGKVMANVPRHEVAFWAQRSLQEFSYDVLHGDKSIELELPPSRVLQLPSDYVNLIKIVKTDDNGNQTRIVQSLDVSTNRAVIQDDNYDYIYDENGDIVTAQDSETIGHFQDSESRAKQAVNYYDGYYYDDDFSFYHNKRFGTEPSRQNINPQYVLDTAQGRIYFNSQIDSGDIITLYYISDGIADNDDLANVYVPKMAEDAMYAAILYNLSKLRPEAAGAASLYKKEAMAKLRNTKIRLQNWRHEEVAQILRGKSKWIKH